MEERHSSSAAMSKQPVWQQIQATITGKDVESGIIRISSVERSSPRSGKSLLRRIVTISDTLMENSKMMISSSCQSVASHQ
jgi:hypothetical protein